MKFPVNWLKEYVKIPISIDKLSYKLTMAGLEVVSIIKKNKEPIFDIEITPNRPDLLSLIGVAREIAALLETHVKIPQTKHFNSSKNKPLLSIEIKNNAKCRLYTAKLIKNVKIHNSPAWLKNKLDLMDIRNVNNVVDITNFCLFETGHPLHAFDYDKIAGKKIIIRHAKSNETIITIDGKKRKLTNQDLVIADKEKPIAIAGIIGGKNTEVTNKTKNVVIESAYFDPISIRKTARRLNITTESSYRFERGTSLDMLNYSSERATNLIVDSTKTAEPDIFIKKSYNKKISTASKTIKLNLKKIEKYLDLKIDRNKIISILKSMQVKCKLQKDFIKAIPPISRQDLTRDVDLIEEIARIYGYEKVSSAIPKPSDKNLHEVNQLSVFKKNKIVRSTFINLGLNEIISYSLISKKDLKKIKYEIENVIQVNNPLSIEQEILRPNMIPSLLKIISSNIKNNNENYFRLFEIGKTYYLKNNLAEKNEIIIAICQLQETNSMKDFKQGKLFYNLKGILQTAFKKLGISNISYKAAIPQYIYYPGTFAELIFKNKKIGTIGYVLEKVCEDFDISSYRLVLANLNLDMINKYMKPYEYMYKKIIKYPASYRDISFIIDKNIYSSKIENLIYETEKNTVSNIEFLDQYTGKQIPLDKKSLTYRITYQATDRTLEDNEINKIHQKIINKLKTNFNIQLR